MNRTQLGFIGMRLLGTPAWCLLSMLAFILYKNFYISSFQIAILIALKPASSLLSPYWTQAIYQRPDRLITNLTIANLLRHLPFVFIPWFPSSWFIIVSYGLYMMLTRATIPAWMEVFKYNLPEPKREQMVSYGSIIDFCGSALLTVSIGFILDKFPEAWQWLFVVTSSLGILSTLLLRGLGKIATSTKVTLERSSFKFKRHISLPWKRVWNLISNNKEFTLFQIGFMLGGSGLMIMQPVLPTLFIDTLNLSFKEMGFAIAVCKAIGVAFTAPLWTRLFRKINIFPFSALVTFFCALFPFLLLATSFHISMLYLAYLFYGIMQAGSEMSWHMSGLVFAKDQESSTYSTTNVLTVGIRGCIIPFLGSLLFPFIHSIGTILLGALLSLLASLHFLFFYKKTFAPISSDSIKNATKKSAPQKL